MCIRGAFNPSKWPCNDFVQVACWQVQKQSQPPYTQQVLLRSCWQALLPDKPPIRSLLWILRQMWLIVLVCRTSGFDHHHCPIPRGLHQQPLATSVILFSCVADH